MNTQDTPAAKIVAEYIKSQIETNLPGVTLKLNKCHLNKNYSRVSK